MEPYRATVDAERCSGCRICNDLCPFNAIEFLEEDNVSHIIESLCKGCGTCVSACPAQVISGAHFSNRQIFAEIEGVLWDASAEEAAAPPDAEAASVPAS